MFELQNGNKQEMIIWICENTQNNEYFRENKLNHIKYIYLFKAFLQNLSSEAAVVIMYVKYATVRVMNEY